MRSDRSVRMATWLMRRFGPSNEALAGDLLEELRQGRSSLWYWREVLVAITVAQLQALGTRLRQKTRSLTSGWTVNVSPKHLIVTAAFFVVYGTLFAADSPFWGRVPQMVVAVSIVASSTVAIVKTIRRREGARYGQGAACPGWLRKWLEDNPSKHRR